MRPNKLRVESEVLAQSVDWHKYIVEQRLSVNQLIRVIGKGETWVRKYVPPSLVAKLAENGRVNQLNARNRRSQCL